jgi:hypothetical protein
MFYSIFIYTVVFSAEETFIRKVTGNVPRLFTAADDFHRLQFLSQCNKSLLLSDTKVGQVAPPRKSEFAPVFMLPSRTTTNSALFYTYH